jgi:hypothetical protein
MNSLICLVLDIENLRLHTTTQRKYAPRHTASQTIVLAAMRVLLCCAVLCTLLPWVLCTGVMLTGSPLKASDRDESVIVVQPPRRVDPEPAVTVVPTPQPEEDVAMMERVLFSLPEPEPELLAAQNKLSKEEMAALLRKVWASRQKQLSEAFDNMKDDAHFMKELLKRLSGRLPAAEIVSILEDLEFHVSKVDNALDFVHVSVLVMMEMIAQ